jgi:uncharacterized protein (DUF486 family)
MPLDATVVHVESSYDKALAMKFILVPLMLLTAGMLMSFAWIGHLRFKSWNFLTALAASWLLVLPEYILNVFSVRWGRGVFSGAQMAAMHLGSGVLSVALIAKLYLGETLSWVQALGFVLMAIAIALILVKP